MSNSTKMYSNFIIVSYFSDMDMSNGWWSVKKFIYHLLATLRLSHRYTFITSSVVIVTMKRYHFHGNYREEIL